MMVMTMIAKIQTTEQNRGRNTDHSAIKTTDTNKTRPMQHGSSKMLTRAFSRSVHSGHRFHPQVCQVSDGESFAIVSLINIQPPIGWGQFPCIFTGRMEQSIVPIHMISGSQPWCVLVRPTPANVASHAKLLLVLVSALIGGLCTCVILALVFTTATFFLP